MESGILRGLIYHLTRPTQVLKPVVRRYMMIPHMVISAAMGYGAFHDSASYSNPVFASIFEWAPLGIWAVAFLIVGAVATHALVSAGWVSYFIANVATCGLSLLWLTALFVARFGQGLDVSAAAFGLWGFIVSTCIVLAATPTRVTRTR